MLQSRVIISRPLAVCLFEHLLLFFLQSRWLKETDISTKKLDIRKCHDVFCNTLFAGISCCVYRVRISGEISYNYYTPIYSNSCLHFGSYNCWIFWPLPVAWYIWKYSLNDDLNSLFNRHEQTLHYAVHVRCLILVNFFPFHLFW